MFKFLRKNQEKLEQVKRKKIYTKEELEEKNIHQLGRLYLKYVKNIEENVEYKVYNQVYIGKGLYNLNKLFIEKRVPYPNKTYVDGSNGCVIKYDKEKLIGIIFSKKEIINYIMSYQ